jgi:hypothetical protein
VSKMNDADPIVFGPATADPPVRRKTRDGIIIRDGMIIDLEVLRRAGFDSEEAAMASPQWRFRQTLNELHPRERVNEDGTRTIYQSAPGPQVLAEALIGILGPEPMTLTECRGLMPYGKERVAAALDIARADSRVLVSNERRPDRAGRPRLQVVLRRAVSL